MSNKIITPVAEFADLLPREYKELIDNGPFFDAKNVDNLGTFREIIDEHPHCAGCGVALGIRLVAAALPAPQDTIIVGTPGCSFFGLSQKIGRAHV